MVLPPDVVMLAPVAASTFEVFSSVSGMEKYTTSELVRADFLLMRTRQVKVPVRLSPSLSKRTRLRMVTVPAFLARTTPFCDTDRKSVV